MIKKINKKLDKVISSEREVTEKLVFNENSCCLFCKRLKTKLLNYTVVGNVVLDCLFRKMQKCKSK